MGDSVRRSEVKVLDYQLGEDTVFVIWMTLIRSELFFGYGVK